MNKELMFSSKSCEWETPQYLFDILDKEFAFTLDVCATPENAKCPKFITEQKNGLLTSWKGETVWCNPPYGRFIGDWVRRCCFHGTPETPAVMLIPARTDTKYFHEWILGKSEIRFIKGRLKFGNSLHPAPFPSMVVIFKGGECNIVKPF